MNNKRKSAIVANESAPQWVLTSLTISSLAEHLRTIGADQPTIGPIAICDCGGAYTIVTAQDCRHHRDGEIVSFCLTAQSFADGFRMHMALQMALAELRPGVVTLICDEDGRPICRFSDMDFPPPAPTAPTSSQK